jgi:hypothetical protein
MTKEIFLTIIIAFGVGCILLSLYLEQKIVDEMKGFQDCYWVHTVPGPTNCADNKMLAIQDDLRFKIQILHLCALGCFLLSVAVPILIHRREEKSNKGDFDSIKIVE